MLPRVCIRSDAGERVFPLLVIDQPTSTAFPVSSTPVAALPIELFSEIVEYLAPAERWRAASVSRDFRAAAHVAGFAIHFRLHWYLQKPIRAALSELSDLFLRIARDNLRISLDFACCPVNVIATWETSLAEFLDIVTIVSAVMPFMTSFTATIPAQFRAVFDERVLCLPAPNLRSLSLTQSFTAERWSPDVDSLPGALFSGETPKLQEVSLFYVPLPADPVRAFACVRTLRIICNNEYPPIDLVRHFPALKTLHAEFHCDVWGPTVSWVERSFAKLSLDELTLDCTRIQYCQPEIGRLLPIKSTRVVRLQGRPPFLEESLTDMLPPGSLSVRLRRVDIGTEFTVVPDHREWRRIFVYDGRLGIDVYSTLARWPSFSATVTYVRLDCSLIGDFLHAEYHLPALRELRIDMHLRSPRGHRRTTTLLPAYPPVEPDFADDPDYDVPCPALRALTLFALDAPAKINALEAAHLGRALGQVAQPKEERARVVLIGVVFSNDSEYAELLDQAFSCVQLRPFAGRDSVEDRQCILWDV